jgi:hypothetical protein
VAQGVKRNVVFFVHDFIKKSYFEVIFGCKEGAILLAESS